MVPQKRFSGENEKDFVHSLCDSCRFVFISSDVVYFSINCGLPSSNQQLIVSHDSYLFYHPVIINDAAFFWYRAR